MAPALTEPVSHRQSKISSPAQASSPRPIISDVSEQTQTTTATNPLHRLAHQTNGGGLSIGNDFAVTKDVQTIQSNDNNQLDEQLLQQSPKKQQNQFKADHFIAPDFQSAFAQHIQTSNGYVDFLFVCFEIFVFPHFFVYSRVKLLWKLE